MIISHNHKFIFIKTFKTAGTSIEVFLSQFCGADDVITPIYPKEPNHAPRNHLDENGSKLFHNHLSAQSIQQRIPKAIWDEYYTFCFERNPWDKTVSHYHFINQSRYDGQLSFDDYVNENKFCLNYPLYTDNEGNILVDKVAKYENIQEEVKKILDYLRIPTNKILDVYAKSKYRPENSSCQMFFSGANAKYIEYIGHIFQREIELHGYSFDAS